MYSTKRHIALLSATGPSAHTFDVCYSSRTTVNCCFFFLFSFARPNQWTYRGFPSILPLNKNQTKMENGNEINEMRGAPHSSAHTARNEIIITNYSRFILFCIFTISSDALTEPSKHTHTHTRTQFAINYATSRQFSPTRHKMNTETESASSFLLFSNFPLDLRGPQLAAEFIYKNVQLFCGVFLVYYFFFLFFYFSNFFFREEYGGA